MLDVLRRSLRARPIILPALGLVSGIVLADLAGLSAGWYLIPAAAGVLVGVWPSSGARAGIGLVVALGALGAALHSANLTPGSADLSTWEGARGVSVSVTVTDCLYERDWRSEYLGEARSLGEPGGKTHRVSGRVRVKLRGAKRLPLYATVMVEDAGVSRPPARTNWHQRDRRKMLARQGIHSIIEARGTRVLDETTARALIARKAQGLRHRMMGLLRASMPGGTAEEKRRDAMLLAGMVFGEDAARVDDDVRELFRRTGTIHLLVVSGAQVSIIVLVIVSLTSGRRRPSWWHIAAIAPLLLFFGLIVGMGPSITRSLIMCGLWALCMRVDRQYDLASSIAVAVIVLTLANPSVVFNVGAQLTFAATIGVAAFLPRRYHHETGEVVPNHGFKSAALGTLGAWVFVTPILMHYFYNLALLGNLANLIAVPVSGAVVIVGLLSVAFGLVAQPVCVVGCWVAKVLLEIILFTNRVFDTLPLSFVDRVYLSTAGCVVWAVAAGALVYLVRTGAIRRWWLGERGRLVTALTAGVAGALLVGCIHSLWPRTARITTFDVGEGQCSLVETADGHTVMIDAGGRFKLTSYEIARDVLAPYLIERGHRHVDLLILTHPDMDHYGAAEYLVTRVPVKTVLTNGGCGEDSYREALGLLASEGAVIRAAGRGTKASVGTARIEFISPPLGAAALDFPVGDNNASLVTRITLPGCVALFPGDVETAGMRRLLADLPATLLRADFLQVPHHGRNSAALDEFFEAVEPGVAAVSRAGLPKQRRGQDACAAVCGHLYSTERAGAVGVEIGRRLRIRTFLPSEGTGGSRGRTRRTLSPAT